MAASGTPVEPGSPEHPAPRRIAGVRISAVVETSAFLAVALLADTLLGSGNRFADVAPHPFWIAVLLASVFYGTNEGIAAATLCTAALLLGGLPEQGIEEEASAWLLGVTLQPAMWYVVAIVLGEIQTARSREMEARQQQLIESRRQAQAISDAYEHLSRLNQNLEQRVAGQLQTVHTLYTASRAIERQGTGEVLIGVSELVRSVMNPAQFSIFLLNGAALEAAASEGWTEHDRFARDFQDGSLLFEAIIARRQFLVVSDPAHELLLEGEGMLAGPLVSSETGELVGMLKIEQIEFLELHPSSVRNFHILCDWTGTAFANAQRVEQLRDSKYYDPVRRLMPPPLFDQQKSTLQALARHLGFDLSAVYLSVPLAEQTEPATRLQVARMASDVFERVLDPAQLRFDYRRSGWDFALLMPGASAGDAAAVVRQLESELHGDLQKAGLPALSRHLIESVHHHQHNRDDPGDPGHADRPRHPA